MKTIILTNETHYLSRDLNKLFTLVLANYKRTTFDFKYDTVYVKCIYRRLNDGYSSGHAIYYNNNHIVMKLPKVKNDFYNKKKLTPTQQDRSTYRSIIEEYVGEEIKPDGDTFEQYITRIYLHLLDFCRGRTNKDIIDSKLRNISYLPADLIVREKEPVVKKKKTDDLKVTVLLERKKKWESKLKRCTTAIKKIEKQVKYYKKKKLTLL